jgi:hypothetical protein
VSQGNSVWATATRTSSPRALRTSIVHQSAKSWNHQKRRALEGRLVVQRGAQHAPGFGKDMCTHLPRADRRDGRFSARSGSSERAAQGANSYCRGAEGPSRCHHVPDRRAATRASPAPSQASGAATYGVQQSRMNAGAIEVTATAAAPRHRPSSLTRR